MSVKLWLVSDIYAAPFSLDDPSLPSDLVQPFSARFVTGKFSAENNAYSHIRSFLQQIFVAGTMTATISPVANGTESLLVSQVFTANSATDGNSVQMLIPLYKGAVDHQVAVTITAHSGDTQLGGAEMWVVPKRQKP